MRVDRLLEIIILLLNKGTMSGRQLAEHFGVSLRTIQRDINTLSTAGIPIIADTGINGGYSILESYKLSNNFVKREDFNIIILALKSLSSSYENAQLNQILDKYLSVSNSPPPPIFVDYSVTKEGGKIQTFNRALETSIHSCLQVEFRYMNVYGKPSQRKVCPYALSFKWYSWYLFAFDVDKQDYRTFKVVRMSNLQITSETFQKPDNVEQLLFEQQQSYYDNCEHILVECSNENIILLEEDFPDAEFSQRDDGSWIMDLYVPLSEKLWQCLLLGLENKAKVISPAHYQDKLIQMAKNFINNYDI